MSDSRSPDTRPAHGWRAWRMEELDRASTTRDNGAEQQRQRDFQHQAELTALRRKVREQARQEGYQAGFAEGREAGHAEGLAEGLREGAEHSERQRRELLAPLASLAGEFQTALATLDNDLADELVDLALATGRQLAGEALKARPHQILAVIRQLLREEPLLSEAPRLWLHPQDLQLVEQEMATELQAVGWTLRADDQLQRGGCRVTSATGELDASGESRWQAVLDRLRRRPRRAPGAKP
ncbi:flagellar assembly protein FliH [Alcanivorax sp. N3-2A]|nr:flagellar assembly protein FliH [Alcanivorax sp. N3-2A]|tara:strand:+ start:4011 stop:4730 length:720 start_codon:yes stop_codon:yes gene_type:complete